MRLLDIGQGVALANFNPDLACQHPGEQVGTGLAQFLGGGGIQVNRVGRVTNSDPAPTAPVKSSAGAARRRCKAHHEAAGRRQSSEISKVSLPTPSDHRQFLAAGDLQQSPTTFSVR